MAKIDSTTHKRHVYKRVPSPVGRLTLVASDDGLAAILWENDPPRRVRLTLDAEDTRHPVLVETERQLEEYFAGRRKQFTLPLDMAGTDFQREVWKALLTIPFGETRSYAADRPANRQSRRPCALSVPRTARIRCRLSRPVIASSVRRVRSRASPADSRSRHGCWRKRTAA